MVFNVQKFESTVRHAQTDRIPAELLLCAKDQKKKPRVRCRFWDLGYVLAGLALLGLQLACLFYNECSHIFVNR